MSAVEVGAGGARVLGVSADFGAADRADEDVVAAVALVGRCLVSGLVGVSFLGSATVAAAARVALVAGLLGAGVSFLNETSDRVDLTAVLLEVLDAEGSGEGFTSRLSRDESVLSNTAEFGLDLGFSSCESVETLSLF